MPGNSPAMLAEEPEFTVPQCQYFELSPSAPQVNEDNYESAYFDFSMSGLDGALKAHNKSTIAEDGVCKALFPRKDAPPARPVRPATAPRSATPRGTAPRSATPRGTMAVRPSSARRSPRQEGPVPGSTEHQQELEAKKAQQDLREQLRRNRENWQSMRSRASPRLRPASRLGSTNSLVPCLSQAEAPAPAECPEQERPPPLPQAEAPSAIKPPPDAIKPQVKQRPNSARGRTSPTCSSTAEAPLKTGAAVRPSTPSRKNSAFGSTTARPCLS